MTLLVAEFPAGAYSSAKVELKEAMKQMGYNYAGGYTPRDSPSQDPASGTMVVNWVKGYSKGNPGKLGAQPPTIRGIFNGSGAACKFELDVDDEDSDVVFALFASYGASVRTLTPETLRKGEPVFGPYTRVQAPAPVPLSDADFDRALERARAEVQRFFSWPKKEPGEPDLFFRKRTERAQAEFDAKVQERCTAIMNGQVA